MVSLSDGNVWYTNLRSIQARASTNTNTCAILAVHCDVALVPFSWLATGQVRGYVTEGSERPKSGVYCSVQSVH
uniref:Uncharacterized protein n=1 Tax=Arundo donax TaxID=35708 RepID=A0A0A9A3L5_ARUDO